MWVDRETAVLDRYIDELTEFGLSLAKAAPAGLEDLAALAQRLKSVLRPVEPSPVFREALHARLLVAAQTGVMVSQPSWPSQHRRELIIGAAVGSALSVAGIVALVVRQRWSGRSAA